MFGPKFDRFNRESRNPLVPIRHDLNRLFDELLDVSAWPLRSVAHVDVFSPKIDVVDDENELRVSAELPGMEEKDIAITLDSDGLRIEGEKKEEREEKGKGFYATERSYGSFVRVIPLPYEVDHDKVEAKFKKGVLTVRMPKVADAKAERKQIPIKGE